MEGTLLLTAVLWKIQGLQQHRFLTTRSYNEGTGKITISGTGQIIGEHSCAIWLNAGIADTTILEISGKMIKSTHSTAVENRGDGKIVISGGSPVISGGYNAMSTAPDLSGYGEVKITASYNSDGSSPVHAYEAYYLKDYKYLKYEPAPVIAQLDGTPYTKLQEAINAITDNGQTIHLLENVNINYTLEIANTNDKSFTLNLNGYTLNSSFYNAIRHYGSGTLTITDNSTGGGGKVTSTNSNSGTVCLEGGSLVVSGGIVENQRQRDNCFPIYNNGRGSVSVVSNGVVKSLYDSAIFNLGVGKITISDNAKVSSPIRSVYNRGTIYLHKYNNFDDILLEINGGTIENTDSGYAIYSAGHGKIAITGGTTVIKGGYMAMNRLPDLSYYPNVKVIASKFAEETPRVIYSPKNDSDMYIYRYLSFVPGGVAAKNMTTGMKYYLVQTAVDEASDGDTLALMSDINYVDPLRITLKDNASLTLDLRGNTFESTIKYICKNTGGKLIIDDTVGGGKITSATSSFSNGTIFAFGQNADTAFLEIKGGTVENADNTNLHFGYGGNAICSASCTVNVTSGTVISSSGGAAILNRNIYPFGSVNVISGTVKNTNTKKSSAIYNEGSGSVSISGGTVDGGAGIAIHNVDMGLITISGTAMVTGMVGINLTLGKIDTGNLRRHGRKHEK